MIEIISLLFLTTEEVVKHGFIYHNLVHHLGSNYHKFIEREKTKTLTNSKNVQFCGLINLAKCKLINTINVLRTFQFINTEISFFSLWDVFNREEEVSFGK